MHWVSKRRNNDANCSRMVTAVMAPPPVDSLGGSVTRSRMGRKNQSNTIEGAKPVVLVSSHVFVIVKLLFLTVCRGNVSLHQQG